MCCGYKCSLQCRRFAREINIWELSDGQRDLKHKLCLIMKKLNVIKVDFSSFKSFLQMIIYCQFEFSSLTATSHVLTSSVEVDRSWMRNELPCRAFIYLEINPVEPSAALSYIINSKIINKIRQTRDN